MSQHEANQITRAAERVRRRAHLPLKLVIPTVAALGAGAGIAVGAIPSSDGTITGCYQTVTAFENDGSPTTPYGTLRLIDPSQTGSSTNISPEVYSCNANESTITWNQQGPQGPTGPRGEQGQPGQQGAQGQQGEQGQPGTPGSVAVSGGGNSQIFMKLDGVNGPSTAKDHKGEIELRSFDLDTKSSGRTVGSKTTGAGAGKISVATFSFVKAIDSASPELFKDLAAGMAIKSADIKLYRSASGKMSEVAEFKLTDVFLTGIHDSLSSKPPRETVDGQYAKITFTTFQTNGTGTTNKAGSSGWDIATNKAALRR